MIFKHRQHAGQLLAEKLADELEIEAEQTVLFALPRGGVPVAQPVAQRFGLQLNLIVVRKLGFPSAPETAMGAIGPEDSIVLDETSMRNYGITQKSYADVLTKERAELGRRIQKYAAGIYQESLAGKKVIIIDDGFATGRTMEAAVQYAYSKDPSQVVVAVPVCPSDSVMNFASKVDQFICLEPKADFMAVGQWYEVFPQVTDEEVLKAIEETNSNLAKT